MKNTLKTIIIDDECPARQRLKDLIAPYSNTLTIIGEAENGRKGLELINQLYPDLVFLDIEMPGMTGFELIENLKSYPIIVFCTAYDQYSLDAFETNSIDYLVKPVKVERFEKTVEKLMRFAGKSNHKDLLHLIKRVNEQSVQEEITSITVKNGNRMKFIKLDDISYFQAEAKLVKIFTLQGEESTTDKSLKELEEKLPKCFIRIHRSIIINKDAIDEIQSYFNSKYVFLLNGKNRIKLFSGRSFQMQIKDWLDLK